MINLLANNGGFTHQADTLSQLSFIWCHVSSQLVNVSHSCFSSYFKSSLTHVIKAARTDLLGLLGQCNNVQIQHRHIISLLNLYGKRIRRQLANTERR